MKFTIDHNNINVFKLDDSIKFYEEALGFKEVRRIEHKKGDFILVFMSDDSKNHSIELTWLRDREEPYNLGDNEIHMAVRTDDFEKAYEYHKNMGCICYENKDMGLYFISDPDGYWTEILPLKAH